MSQREKLVGLLNYIEQVVRLDERVPFRLAEYSLPDRSHFSLHKGETQDLPGVRHNVRDDEGATWLEVERLARKDPPKPPKEIADWLAISSDPATHPTIHQTIRITVSAGQRDDALAKGHVRPEDILEAPVQRGDEGKPPSFDLLFRLEDRPNHQKAIESWINESWYTWSVEETPRRRTIRLYQDIFRLIQLLEAGGSDKPIELIWGIGLAHWNKAGRILERPFLERRVDIEIDDGRAGLIRIRPTGHDAWFDHKPYEHLGCTQLASLADLVKREVLRAADQEGVSPFNPDTYETILLAAATRLDGEGSYKTDVERLQQAPDQLTITDNWALFARPRSAHIVLTDIERLRQDSEDDQTPLEGLSVKLVTEPSRVNEGGTWQPLNNQLGATRAAPISVQPDTPADDVFFPKPFNDDQREIVRRLSKADGFVVQGPPGTGKTHTIANLICHCMATGQRVLVVSHGDAALHVLRDQLPQEVRQLAIAVLANEREGLRQVENAVRQVQRVVETGRQNERLEVIQTLETRIQASQQKLAAIDEELNEIAELHLNRQGPRGETPGEMALHVAAEREAYAWFTDRPTCFSQETQLTDEELSALCKARKRVGSLIDRLGAKLPAPEDLPDASTVAQWHDDLINADKQLDASRTGPAATLSIAPDIADAAHDLAEVLQVLSEIKNNIHLACWIDPVCRAVITGNSDPWRSQIEETIKEFSELRLAHAALLRRPVELPKGLLNNKDAIEAIRRAAGGKRIWQFTILGKADAKSLTNAVKVDGRNVQPDDADSWAHVLAVIAHRYRELRAFARWDAIAQQIGAPYGPQRQAAIDYARAVLDVCQRVHHAADLLSSITSRQLSGEGLYSDASTCVLLAQQIKAASAAARLSAADVGRQRIIALFAGGDRSSLAIAEFLTQKVGNTSVSRTDASNAWSRILHHLRVCKSREPDLETIKAITAKIDEAGAPAWARDLRTKEWTDGDAAQMLNWRGFWDFGAAEALLSRMDKRERLTALLRHRTEIEGQSTKLFGELVRERTFYSLHQRLNPAVKAALVEFVHALANIGAGTGKSAWIHRRAARDAMARCYDAVPCWIMPSWRVAEQLPAKLGAVDLVILDEASQSDITELPALLRGKKILVVGDDRQVSPTAPFVTHEKIEQLVHHFLKDAPFKNLMRPGDSLYDLMRAVFPDDRLMLKEHFRCVEPIVRFSMQFYQEELVPLRIPTAAERLDPPLVDIYVPYGIRSNRRKINEAEAEVIVREIARIARLPSMANRSIGVISLIGDEQADLIRVKLGEELGEELIQRHSILCGDSATFQGTERDIVFLSMVADESHRKALTGLRYQQRFNVAASRARDQLFLVRSIKRDNLNPADLKAKLIAHFENPMPSDPTISEDALNRCESGFERDVMRELINRHYRVSPQVGSLGFRIDMVVEGDGGRRLAVECDGDMHHGPEQWRNDMRRQQILERVGWCFWRCFASSFYRDREGVIEDLVATLARMGIQPLSQSEADARSEDRWVEYRVASQRAAPNGAGAPREQTMQPAQVEYRIAIGDRVHYHIPRYRKAAFV